MPTLTIKEAFSDLDNLIDQVALSHEPIHILGKDSTAVLVSKDDWQDIQRLISNT